VPTFADGRCHVVSVTGPYFQPYNRTFIIFMPWSADQLVQFTRWVLIKIISRNNAKHMTYPANKTHQPTEISLPACQYLYSTSGGEHSLISPINIRTRITWLEDTSCQTWSTKANRIWSLMKINCSVGIPAACGLDDRGSIPYKSKRFFSSAQCPSGLWILQSPSPVGLYPLGKAIQPWRWPFTSVQCRDKEQWGYASSPSYVIIA
jgi:hypothetical protein